MNTKYNKPDTEDNVCECTQKSYIQIIIQIYTVINIYFKAYILLYLSRFEKQENNL